MGGRDEKEYIYIHMTYVDVAPQNQEDIRRYYQKKNLNKKKVP